MSSRSEPATKGRALTRDELALAHHLLREYEEAYSWIERLDPHLRRDNSTPASAMARRLVEIARIAAEGFTRLTGRTPLDRGLHSTDFSTINPAAWTKNVDTPRLRFTAETASAKKSMDVHVPLLAQGLVDIVRDRGQPNAFGVGLVAEETCAPNESIQHRIGTNEKLRGRLVGELAKIGWTGTQPVYDRQKREWVV